MLKKLTIKKAVLTALLLSTTGAFAGEAKFREVKMSEIPIVHLASSNTCVVLKNDTVTRGQVQSMLEDEIVKVEDTGMMVIISEIPSVPKITIPFFKDINICNKYVAFLKEGK